MRAYHDTYTVLCIDTRARIVRTFFVGEGVSEHVAEAAGRVELYVTYTVASADSP
jgi:hypothetical protein